MRIDIKKTTAFVLAAVLTMSVGISAFAATQIGPGGTTYDDQKGPGSLTGDAQKDGYGPGNPGGAKTGGSRESAYEISSDGEDIEVKGVSADTTANQVNINANVAKPEISSEAACLYDATTGQVLFDKNCNKAMGPASTTKLLTALIAAERLGMEDTLKFSASATQNLESGASTVGMTAGDSMKVKDAMYALLLKSACEVANALGEAVSGSQKNFAEYMNSRAQEIGCRNTHFANASGLNDTNHYTTAFDLCLITHAALSNSAVRTAASSVTYALPATSKRAAMTLTNGNKMLNKANAEYYNGIIGGKTGYTSKPGNTLATAATVGGHELVAVVLKSNSKHYEDTKALYNYGAKLIAASGSGSTGTSGNVSVAANAYNGKWQQTDGKWQFVKANGTLAKNEWIDLSGNTYFIGSDGYMATGWKQFTNGSWYYFNPDNGAMVRSKWVNQDGKSYYLTNDGTMAKDTVIDGKYRVDANGVYQPS